MSSIKNSEKLEVLVNNLKVYLWQEKGVVYRQIEGEEPEVQLSFENTKKGRLEAGAYMGGILEGIKWTKTMF